MGFEAPPLKKGSGVLCPQGTFIARCIRVIDFGTQVETFQGQAPREVPQIAFTFEIPSQTHIFDEAKGAEPFTLTARYSKTSNREKGKLLPMIDAWLGQPVPDAVIAEGKLRYDKMLNRPAMITVLHKDTKGGTKSARITTITNLPAGVVCPPPWLHQYVYSVAWGKENPFPVYVWDANAPGKEGKPGAFTQKTMKFEEMNEWVKETCNLCTEWRPTQEEAGQTGGDESTGSDGQNPW